MTKLISLPAAARLVKDGDMVAIGGQTLYRRPVAVVRELIRQGRRDLTVVGLTAGFETDMLLAKGCVSTVRSGYTGFDFLGLAPHLGKDRSVRIVEETEASIIQGVKAALGYVGFLPFRGAMQTDLARVRPDVKTVRCPYSGEELIAWPAIKPDVALVHALRADEYGNAVLPSNPSIDRLWAAAAATTIVSAEEIVESSALEGGKATILGRSVAAVVHAPMGAHPTSCYPRYRIDVPYLLDYVSAAREQRVEQWLAERLAPELPEYVERFVTPNAEQLMMAEV